jgi:hypothetical protein
MIEEFAVRQVEAGLQNQRENLRHIRTQGAVIGTLSVLLGGYLRDQEVLTLDFGTVVAGNRFDSFFTFSSLSDAIGLGLMLTSVAFAMFVILMQAKWRFFLEEEFILDTLQEQLKFNERETLDACAKELDHFFWENEVNIKKLNASLFGAVACGIGQVPFWVIS